ncbi:MAG: RNA 3'-terminal phosphate cyclase, partial [Nanobdellota archaeon]
MTTHSSPKQVDRTKNITIDCSLHSASGGMIRNAVLASSLSGTPVILKNIFSKREPSGANESILQLISIFAHATKAVVSGLGVGSSTISFQPTIPFHPKKSIALQYKSPHNASLSLFTILIACMYQQRQILIRSNGVTHGKNGPSIDVLNTAFLPFIRSQVDKCVLSINTYSFYPSYDGDILCQIKGKRSLDSTIPRFDPRPHPDLSAVRAVITTNLQGPFAKRTWAYEQILTLAFKGVASLSLNTHTVPLSSDGCGITLSALYGKDNGFDTDLPWLHSKDLCGFSDDTTSFDSRLYALIKDFKKELHTNTV